MRLSELLTNIDETQGLKFYLQGQILGRHAGTKGEQLSLEEWSSRTDSALGAILKMRMYSQELTEEEFRANWIKKAVDFLNQNKLEFSKLCFNAIGHDEG